MIEKQRALRKGDDMEFWVRSAFLPPGFLPQGQLFFEVFASKREIRRTTLVLLQLGHLIGLIFF